MHMFYSQRVIDIPDGLPKWSGINNDSDLIEDSPEEAIKENERRRAEKQKEQVEKDKKKEEGDKDEKDEKPHKEQKDKEGDN